jgi:hypothetical protein
MEEVFLRNKKPVIRWGEPYDGMDIKNLDNGFCNRVFHWEIGYFLNQYNKYDFDLYVEDYYWPELEFINLPNTHTIVKQPNQPLNEYHELFRTPMNNKKTIVMDKNVVSRILDNKNYKLDNKFNFVSNFGYDYTWKFINFYSQRIQRPLKNIKIRDFDLDVKLKRILHNSVGIHIRRGYGVMKNKIQAQYLNDLDLSKTFKVDTKGPYTFFEDQKYMYIINSLIDDNPDIKIYISTDLEDKSLYHFKSQYPHNIITFSNLLEDNLIKKYYYKFHDDQKRQMCKNMIDLFALSYTDFIIKSNDSTWSQFASEYRTTPSIYISENNDDIVTSYYKHIN